MVDAPNSNSDPQQPVAPAAEEKPAGFLASTTGKLIVGGIALVAVLIVARGHRVDLPLQHACRRRRRTPAFRPRCPAASAHRFWLSSRNRRRPGHRPAAAAAREHVHLPQRVRADAEAADVAERAHIDHRAATSTAMATMRLESASDVDVPEDTLYLVSIQTVDGEKTATFIWNDSTYTLAEGDTFAEHAVEGRRDRGLLGRHALRRHAGDAHDRPRPVQVAVAANGCARLLLTAVGTSTTALGRARPCVTRPPVNPMGAR